MSHDPRSPSFNTWNATSAYSMYYMAPDGTCHPPPTASSHTHAWADITHPTTIAGYGITDGVASNHTHDTSTLVGVAGSSHTHAFADLSGAAAATHTHAQADVTNLVNDLAGKSATGHTHAFAAITAPPTTRAGYGITDAAASSHTHPTTDITGLIPFSIASTGASYNISTTALSNITGLSFSVAANTLYAYQFLVLCSAATDATTGLRWAVTCPASPTVLSYRVSHPQAADGTAASFDGWGTIGGDTIVGTAIASANTQLVARIDGILRNGANAGTLQVQAGSEIANSFVSIHQYSVGMLWTL